MGTANLLMGPGPATVYTGSTGGGGRGPLCFLSSLAPISDILLPSDTMASSLSLVLVLGMAWLVASLYEAL